MDTLLQDLTFGARLLLKDRAFTLTAVLTLALCIGANAAIFTVVDSVLLRPLPFPSPDRLLLLYNSYPKAGVERASTSAPHYLDRRRELDVFEEQGLYAGTGVNIGDEGNAERVRSMTVTPSLLRLLAVQPQRGRIFTDDEGEIGNERKVILSHSLWQRLYGGDEGIVGREVRIDGRPCTVVGIMPREFLFVTSETELWTPQVFTEQQRASDARHNNNWTMVARLKPGATLEQARAQLDAWSAREIDRTAALRELLINAGYRAVVVPLQSELVRNVTGTLYLLWGGVLFVLLIGCVNITNLVLVRASVRLKELATRQALGAGRARMARQLLTETLMLTVAGGAFGLLLAYWSLGLLSTLGLDELPRGGEIHMAGRIVLFVLALSGLVGIVIGIVPLAGLFRANLGRVVREEGRSGTASRSARLIRRALVTAQLAFAFVLLIGAGLLLASFREILAVDPGFNPRGVVTGSVNPPRAKYENPVALRSLGTRALERIRALPGVEAAGLTSSIPLGDNNSDSVILAEGHVMKPGESVISPTQTIVSPGYFEAMGIRLRRGRSFTDADSEAVPRVMIVDERLAARFWPGTDPIGRRMYLPGAADEILKPGPKTEWLTVVGVVREVKQRGLVDDGDDRVGSYYFPFAQAPRRLMTFAVRTGSDSSSITGAIRGEIAAIDPELPLFDARTMTERLDSSLVRRRTPMLLALGFGIIALLLSGVGIYGTLAYQVAQRRKEIGIRLALGSDATGIFRLVLREGAAIVVIGLGLGFAGAFVLRRALESQLYGIAATDPLVLSIVAILLAGVALAACVVPARRASRTNPIIALAE